jgi:putative flippase GtrA
LRNSHHRIGVDLHSVKEVGIAQWLAAAVAPHSSICIPYSINRAISFA